MKPFSNFDFYLQHPHPEGNNSSRSYWLSNE